MIMSVFAISIILLGLVIGNESGVLEWPDEAISKENDIGRKDFQNIDLVELKTDLSLVDGEKDSSSLENTANSRLTTRSNERKSDRWSRLQSWCINLRGRSKGGKKYGGLFKGGFGGMFKRKPKTPERTPDPKFKHIVTESGPNGQPVVYIPHPEPGSDGIVDFGRVFDTNQNAYIQSFKLFLKCDSHKG